MAETGKSIPIVRENIRVHTRWCIRRDLPFVLRIDALSFSDPLTEDDVRALLNDRETIGMVAEVGDRVLGYAIYRLGKKHIEVLRLAVDPDVRYCGVGSAMLQKLATKLSSHHRKALSVRVRESNLGAQLFLKSNGFRCIKVVRRWFDDTNEDAYLMRLGTKRSMTE